MSVISKQNELSPMVEGIISNSEHRHKYKKTLTRKRMKVEDLPLQYEQTPGLDLLLVAYKDRLADKLTHREFMESVILWSYHYCFEKDGYIPKRLPEKPFTIQRFDKLSSAEMKAMNPDVLEKLKQEKLKYLDERAMCLRENKNNMNWLAKMADYFTYKEDIERENQINQRIELYKGVC